MFEVREAPVNEGEYVGIISLKTALDFEKKSQYSLAVSSNFCNYFSFNN